MEGLLGWIWLAAGLLLMLSELLIPGLVVIFLGLAALTVAGAVAIGLITSPSASLMAWILTSFAYVLGLRWTVERFLPGESHVEIADDVKDAFGASVEVVERVTDEGTRGRVRYQGTTWPARAIDGTIEVGQRAVIVYRDALAWVVEPERPGLDPHETELRRLES